MAILFYPFPASQPNSALPQYVLGDYYVSQNGAPVQLTYNAITKKNAWTKYTASPLVGGISASINGGPPVITSTLVNSTTITSGLSASFKPVTAYGGSATATSFSTTGTVTGLTISVSPALPTGLTATTALTVKSITGTDGVPRLYNSVDVTISGTTNAALANTTFVVTFTDAGSQTATASFNLTVESGIAVLDTVQSVNSKSLTQSVAATAFTPVTATGGDAPLIFTVSPSLPTGLSFSSTTGQITGTPTVASPSTVYTVTVTDKLAQTSSKTFSLTVTAPVVVTTLASSAYSLTRTVAFTQFKPVSGTGGIGTLTYSILPTLPAGLSFNTSTGNISGPGTATASLTTYTVTVTDSNTPAQTSSKSFTITVVELAALNSTLLTASSSLTKNSQSYSFTPVTASGGYNTLTYAISPSLSAGLSFNTASGQITGTPSALLSTTNYTVTITDQASQSTSKSFSITVLPGALSSTLAISNKVAVQNVVITAFTPVTGSGGDGTLSYAISPTLPSGLIFTTSTGRITGTPSIANGATSYTVTVSDQAGQTNSKAFTLTVEAPPVLTTQAIPSKILTQYDAITAFTPVTAAGGYGTLTYSISPALPTGVAFSASTGQITGTPTAYLVNATVFTVTVADTAQQSSSKSFNLTVNTRPLVAVIAIASKTLIRGVAATTFTPVTATGGSETYTYAISSGLPSGLTFSTVDGKVTGTPSTTSASTNYTVTITDSLSVTSTGTFSIIVNDPPAIVTTSQTSSSTFYRLIDSVSITPVGASGGYGSISFAINPSLVSGLSFNSSNGKITGIATSIIDQVYTITATDSIAQSSSKTYHLIVEDPPLLTEQVIAAKLLTKNKVITAFTPVTSTGGSGLTTFAITPALQTGLTFNVSTGQISGKPADVLTLTTYTITATDSAGHTSSKTFTITVELPAALVTTLNTSSVVLTVGQSVLVFTPVTASGGDGQIAYAIDKALPAGLTFDVSTGQVSGTPAIITSVATYTVTATDSLAQTSSKAFQLAIIPLPVSITINNATLIYTEYTAITPVIPVGASGGKGAITYALSLPLPTGLSFNTSTGEITGTPTSSIGVTTYTVTATDSIGQYNTGDFTLTISDVAPATLTAVAASSLINLEIDAVTEINPVTGSGGFGTFSYAINPTELPVGLIFNSGTGSISGTPTVATAVQTFTVTVTDAVPQTSVASFSLAVIIPNIVNARGYSGSSGYTGSIGYSGSKGYVGSTGYIGSAGYTGSTGVGYTGSEGYTGSTGYIGSAGYSGSLGYTGSAGYNGSAGYTGSQGVGYTGSTGVGYTGSQGVGYTGSRGLQGLKGDSGTGSGGYFGNFDGGQPDSNYGGITSIDAGSV